MNSGLIIPAALLFSAGVMATSHLSLDEGYEGQEERKAELLRSSEREVKAAEQRKKTINIEAEREFERDEAQRAKTKAEAERDLERMMEKEQQEIKERSGQ